MRWGKGPLTRSKLRRGTHAPVLRRAHGGEKHEGEGARQLLRVLFLGQARGIQGWVIVVVVVVVGGEEVAPELERAGEVGLLLSGECVRLCWFMDGSMHT